MHSRYYDPKIARFIQIDNVDRGTKDSVASQNKYVYTLNNPYKYVDRDGNTAYAFGNVFQYANKNSTAAQRKNIIENNKVIWRRNIKWSIEAEAKTQNTHYTLILLLDQLFLLKVNMGTYHMMTLLMDD